MARGGARPGAGRKRKSLAVHTLAGTFRAHRLGDPAPTRGAVLPMPKPAAVTDWRPSAAERVGLSPRAVTWLDATLGFYVLSALEGQQVLEAMRVLSRCEMLETSRGWARRRRWYASGELFS